MMIGRRELAAGIDRLRRHVLNPRKGKTYLERFASGGPKGIGEPACEMEALFRDHKGRVIHKWQHYLAIYDELLADYKSGLPGAGHRPLRFLEIGVNKGGSLQLWRKFLGPEAIIFGVDVDPSCASVADADVQVRIGSQADPEFLKSVVAEMGGIDVVLDDGSHIGEHQHVSFTVLFPLLAEGGLYLIEDLHTSYWPEWQGGYRRKGTGIELCKTLIDDLHGWYHENTGQIPEARSSILRVSVFDSIAAIHKQKRLPPRHMTSPGS